MNDNGTVVWSELMTTEVEKAKAFYGRTLGLGFEAFGDGAEGYWLATRDGKPVWGIMDMTGKPGGPSGWFTYMTVDDLDVHVKAAEEAGAVRSEAARTNVLLRGVGWKGCRVTA